MDPNCQDSACAGALRGASRSLQFLRVPGDGSLATHPHFSIQLPFFSTQETILNHSWFSNPGYLKRERRVFYNLKPQIPSGGVHNAPTLLLGKPLAGMGMQLFSPNPETNPLVPFPLHRSCSSPGRASLFPATSGKISLRLGESRPCSGFPAFFHLWPNINSI